MKSTQMESMKKAKRTPRVESKRMSTIFQIRQAFLTQNLKGRLERPARLVSALVTMAILTVLVSSCVERYEFNGVVIENETPAHDITGIDGDGEPFQLSDHRGEFVMVNFGYTFCPDVCPFTLADLSTAYRQLEEENPDLSEELSIVFVTVDPARDTPEQLKAYTDAFLEEMYGVYIGDEKALETTKSAYGVFSETVPPEDPEKPDSYFVNHSAGVFVVDPDGNFRLYFPYETEVEQMVADMEYLLRRG